MPHRILLGRHLHPAGMAVLNARAAELDIVTLHDAPPEEFNQHLSSADAALLWLERIDQAALDIAPRLKVVARLGVGYDTVDVAACTARRIPVMVVNGTNDLSVAEHAMMLMLAVARRAAEHDRTVKGGGWWSSPDPGMVDLAGRKVLVVGYGRIGSRVANYCRAFHMQVSVLDPGFHPARIAADGFACARDLHAALAEADVVTLHCPLSPATHHLMDEAAFAALKPGAILVNTARGPIVSQDALVAALRAGRLHGVGLDVLEVEPSDAANPLHAFPNVLVSPHNAASTEEGLARMARQAARNILDALDGRPDPAMMVNPELRAEGETVMIDDAGFRADLARDGYELVERSLPPGPPGEAHTHPFDARLLILDGAFTVTMGGTATTFHPGDICEVPAGTPHAEAVGPEGARYIAGRRHKA